MGLFAAPNQTGIMNSLPPDQRGAGAGMAATFQNSAMALSIGIFCSLVIIGLAGSLPGVLYHGLSSNGVPHADALRISHLPPVGSLFASFLGYNPIGTLLGPSLHHIPTAAYLTGHKFFPRLVSRPFAAMADLPRVSPRSVRAPLPAHTRAVAAKRNAIAPHRADMREANSGSTVR